MGNQHPVFNRQNMRQAQPYRMAIVLWRNVGAKNTLAMNYLPMARRAGAELFTQTEVHRIENSAVDIESIHGVDMQC